jgi:CRP-like cAMP-binding protein
MQNNQTEKDRAIELLEEIKQLLIPIHDHFLAEYKEREKHRAFLAQKQDELNSIVSGEPRLSVFSLLFEQKNVTQSDIAETVGCSQPTVSRLIVALKQADLIEEIDDEFGSSGYRNKYGLWPSKLNMIMDEQ